MDSTNGTNSHVHEGKTSQSSADAKSESDYTTRHEGTLQKQGTMKMKWSQKWAVLANGRLSFSREDKPLSPTSHSSVDMSQVEFVRQLGSTKRGAEFEITLKQKGPKIMLCAADDLTCHEWVKALQNSMMTEREKRKSISLHINNNSAGPITTKDAEKKESSSSKKNTVLRMPKLSLTGLGKSRKDSCSKEQPTSHQRRETSKSESSTTSWYMNDSLHGVESSSAEIHAQLPAGDDDVFIEQDHNVLSNTPTNVDGSQYQQRRYQPQLSQSAVKEPPQYNTESRGQIVAGAQYSQCNSKSLSEDSGISSIIGLPSDPEMKLESTTTLSGTDLKYFDASPPIVDLPYCERDAAESDSLLAEIRATCLGGDDEKTKSFVAVSRHGSDGIAVSNLKGFLKSLE